jgi:glycosyltransferase involved in cell wall biosynthesis
VSAASSDPRYAVVQLGARMHYAVPRILHRRGWLERLFTDAYASSIGYSLLADLAGLLPFAAVKRFAGRRIEGVAPARIHPFTTFGIRYSLRNRAARTRDEQLRTYLWANTEFGSKVVQAGFGQANSLYAFNTSALEVLTAARQHGLKTVLEQTIAPFGLERQLLADEREKYPAWESPDARVSDSERAFEARERAEWELSDQIVCGSQFVMDALCRAGVPASRCAVIPYGITIEDFNAPARVPGTDPLRALTVGTLGLRKGTPYILGAARALQGLVRFRLVGLAPLPPALLADLTSVADVAGPVPRSQMRQEFARADVFVLPSVCEGSATATYEALAAGLPVVCTPNAGSMVRDGIDGYVVPPGDLEALVGRLDQLASNPSLRSEMSRNARIRAEELSLSAYSTRLLTLLGSVTAA